MFWLFEIIHSVALYGTLLLLIILPIFYWHRFAYWKNKGVEGPKPIPFFGNIFDLVTRRASLGGVLYEIYHKYKHLPYVGIYMFHKPVLFIRDLDVIRNIVIKDFAYFTDHGIEIDPTAQPLVAHLFNLKGGKWKSVRNKLTPAFTSSKIKYMFETILKCGKEFEEYLEEYADTDKGLNVKEICAKYTTNVIASSAFGIDSNCFKYPDAEFRVMGKRMVEFNLKRTIYIILSITLPEIQRVMKGKIVEETVEKFFLDVVEKTVKFREENNETRNDILQLLIRLKNSENIDEEGEVKKTLEDNEVADVKLTLLELAAHSFGFYIGGFETSSTTLSYIFYELAKHPQIQDKLLNEIQEVLERHKGVVTYDAINEMHYLTQVIDESMRLNSTLPQLPRICTKDYVIPNTNLVIEKGTRIMMSIRGIHMDPNYYPDPDRFDPDRFSLENKASRHHFTFMPFGEGPRMCIGQRFALMQIKLATVLLINRYKVELGNTDNINLMGNNPIFSTPVNVFVKFKNRHNI